MEKNDSIWKSRRQNHYFSFLFAYSLPNISFICKMCAKGNWAALFLNRFANAFTDMRNSLPTYIHLILVAHSFGVCSLCLTRFVAHTQIYLYNCEFVFLCECFFFLYSFTLFLLCRLFFACCCCCLPFFCNHNWIWHLNVLLHIGQ